MQRYFKGTQPHINIEKNRSVDCFFAWSTREGFGDSKEILILREGNKTAGI